MKEIKRIFDFEVTAILTIAILLGVVLFGVNILLETDMFRFYDKLYDHTLVDIVCSRDKLNNLFIVEYYDKFDNFSLIREDVYDVDKIIIIIMCINLLIVNLFYFCINTILLIQKEAKQRFYNSKTAKDAYYNFEIPKYSIILRIALLKNTRDVEIIQKEIKKNIDSDNMIYHNIDEQEELYQMVMLCDTKSSAYSFEGQKISNIINTELKVQKFIKEKTILESIMDHFYVLKAKDNTNTALKVEGIKWGMIALVILVFLIETAGNLTTTILIMLGLIIVFKPVFFLPLSSLGLKERKNLVLYNEMYEKENKINE